MFEQLINTCEVTAIAITGSMIRKYVFLELSLQQKTAAFLSAVGKFELDLN